MEILWSGKSSRGVKANIEIQAKSSSDKREKGIKGFYERAMKVLGFSCRPNSQ